MIDDGDDLIEYGDGRAERRGQILRRVVWPIVAVGTIGIAGHYWLGTAFVAGCGIGFFLFAVTFRMNSGYWPFED